MGTMNQTTPYGSMTYTQNGFDTITGPDGTTYEVPRYSADVALSPEAQGAVDANIGASRNMAELARSQSMRLGDIMGAQPDIRDTVGGTRERAEEALMSRLNPQLERDRESLRTSLANQGIREGSTAFDRSMGRFGEQSNDARMQAIINAGGEQSRAIQNEIALRSAPINEITAAMSGGQVQMPQFTNPPTATMDNVDTAGLIMDQYNAQMQQYQMQQAQQQQMLGGLLGLGGNLAMAFSDRRLKADIERIGENGPLGVYRFRYLWDVPGTERIGYMADEVLRVKPEAVSEVGGWLAVDYGQLRGVA